MAEQRRLPDGRIIERLPDGTIREVPQAGMGGSVRTRPADPTMPYQGPKAGADLTGTNLTNTGKVYENQVDAATIDANIRKAIADAAKAEADAITAKAQADAKSSAQARRGDNDPASKLADIVKSIDGIAADAQDNGGWFETGLSGYGLGKIPGTAAYDLKGKIAKIDANNAFNELQQMRENSPTGGALGGIAVEELKMLKSTIANLDPNMSQDEFIGQLQTARDHYSGLIGKIDPQNQYAVGLNYNGQPRQDDVAQNQNITPSVNQGLRDNANNAGGSQTQVGNNGFDRYVTEQDNAFHAEVTGLFKQKATPAQIRDFINKRGYGGQYRDADIANAVAYRDGTGRYAKQGPQKGAGFQKPETGQRSLGQQNLGALADTNFGAGSIALANAMSLGTVDDIAGLTMGDRAGELTQMGKEYARDNYKLASFGGDIIGGMALGGPLTSGVRYAGIKGAQAASPFAAKLAQTAAGSLPRAAVTASTLQGALTGAGEMNDNRLLGASIGGGAGLAGGYLGSKIFGGVNNAATSGPATRGGNRVRGLFGRRQRPEMPVIDKSSQMVNNTIGGDMGQILTRLTQADELGVPMTLADQPQLTSLAGATVRRSPTAKVLADDIMEPRARAQYERLTGAIERDFGPIANVPQLSDDLIKQARAQSGPLYRQAFDAPGASSVDVSGIVKTPMGNLALQKAAGRVQNKLGPDGQPLDPQSLGFDIGAGNEVTLGQTPSFETLDYMKRGLDDIIDGGYDPIARSFTPEAQAAQALKQNLVGQMDNVNPAYAQARSVYAGKAQERGALQQGQKALSMTPDTMNFQRQALSPSQQQQYGLGYRSAMSEQAGRTRYAANPFETAYGTPQAQQKVASLFPEGAERFGQQYDLERLIAKSKNEITGNSMTAARSNADADFAPGMMQTAALDAATGSPGIMSMARLGAKLGSDELGRIGAKRKAEALAPILFDADPAKNAAVLRELQKNIKVQKRAKGLFGGKARALGAVAGGAPSVGFAFGLSD